MWIVLRSYLIAVVTIFRVIFADDSIKDLFDEGDAGAILEDTTERELQFETLPINNAIENFELTAALAEKQLRAGVDMKDETKALYLKLVTMLEDILELCKFSPSAHVFLKVNGLRRIISPNLMIPFSPMRKQLILILKTLLEIVPNKKDLQVPSEIADKLVSIFENDDNLAHKAYILDILNLWLPGNPKIQAQVIRKKGLEPFYNQVAKLDIQVIYSMLDLLNKILEEHLSAMNNTQEKTKVEIDNLVLYRQMGFVEKISTSTACDGLLNIFQLVWKYKNNEDVFDHIADILTNVKGLCIERFSHHKKAVVLFDEMLKYVNDDSKQEPVHIKNVIKDYVSNLKVNDKDEF